GVHVLSPYQQITGTAWYKGTANAIYQNIPFIERYSPDYVLVLSGDHIYKMDYAKMLDFHKEKQAACTIAMLEVPWEEASRFGLMVVGEDGSIVEFEEKPPVPSSNKASMGVYVFTWEKLRQYLIDDEAKEGSGNDFGKDVIPAMHAAGERMCAYAFDGYWKDVGTVDSLWEANLDLLNPKADIDLNDPDWKIYYRSPAAPPHYVSEGSLVQNSIIAEGCVVEGEVDFSVLFPNVSVEPGAVVRDSILMPGAQVKAGAAVQYAIVAENAVVGENASVGARPEETPEKGQWGVAVVGAGLTVGRGAVVPPNAMIDSDVGGAVS
ncbi:MAG: sugar phosphate nucleotidyltransferase, partial [Firmicutes bacterium]|nr:sugar phosphate nucleotidyltransferase [Bacillota bacterium]